MHLFSRLITVLLVLAPLASASAADPDTNALFDHQLRRLHSPEVVNLREHLAGQPLLVVNTASHCGFTRQFGGLEEVFQRYRDAGLRVVGFPSNDFNQEAADEAVTAAVCFENFGVSFDMFAPISVRGQEAHPIFRELARQSAPPRWNFYKYVVDRDGRVVAHFSSMVGPGSRELQRAIESVL